MNKHTTLGRSTDYMAPDLDPLIGKHMDLQLLATDSSGRTCCSGSIGDQHQLPLDSGSCIVGVVGTFLGCSLVGGPSKC